MRTASRDFGKKFATVEKGRIERRESSVVSSMPEDLLNVLSVEQILDLLAYLESGGNAKHDLFKKGP